MSVVRRAAAGAFLAALAASVPAVQRPEYGDPGKPIDPVRGRAGLW